MMGGGNIMSKTKIVKYKDVRCIPYSIGYGHIFEYANCNIRAEKRNNWIYMYVGKKPIFSCNTLFFKEHFWWKGKRK